MKKNIVRVAVVLALAGVGNVASAVNGVALEGGSGDGADMGRIAIQWDWKSRWFESETWHLGGYWDLGLGYWHMSAPPGFNEDITEVGLTPVFRLQRNDLRGPYLEGAIGFHLLSRTTLGDKRFSTMFQFGDLLGAGIRFGARGEFDVSYRFQHFSNSGIKKPNDGIEFHQIRFQYHF